MQGARDGLRGEGRGRRMLFFALERILHAALKSHAKMVRDAKDFQGLGFVFLELVPTLLRGNAANGDIGTYDH